jgi:hypothetical protein
MDAPQSSSAPLTQTYLIERDAGLVCRILGLYASRNLDLFRLGYDYAARDVMKLDVCVDPCGEDVADTLRVLVDKASTFVGVIAACEQPAARSRSG